MPACRANVRDPRKRRVRLGFGGLLEALGCCGRADQTSFHPPLYAFPAATTNVIRQPPACHQSRHLLPKQTSMSGFKDESTNVRSIARRAANETRWRPGVCLSIVTVFSFCENYLVTRRACPATSTLLNPESNQTLVAIPSGLNITEQSDSIQPRSRMPYYL